MFENNKNGFYAVLGINVAYCAYYVGKSIKTHIEERAKRKKIKEDRDLTIQATARASRYMSDKLDKGDYDYSNPVELIEDLDHAIEFEKIAIRYDR